MFQIVKRRVALLSVGLVSATIGTSVMVLLLAILSVKVVRATPDVTRPINWLFWGTCFVTGVVLLMYSFYYWAQRKADLEMLCSLKAVVTQVGYLGILEGFGLGALFFSFLQIGGALTVCFISGR